MRLAYATTSARAALTATTMYLLVSATGASMEIRALCLALGAATFWCQLAWLLGYRPAIPQEVAERCGVLAVSRIRRPSRRGQRRPTPRR